MLGYSEKQVEYVWCKEPNPTLINYLLLEKGKNVGY